MIDRAFGNLEFERLGRTTSESEASDVLRPKVDRLITLVNRLPQAQRLDQMRMTWNPGSKPGEFFRPRVWLGVDYIHGSAGHWYIYHRGGRWEPQFNIGMYGTPGNGYVRVGLGFNTTTQSRDPEREAGAARVRALLGAFHQLAKSALREQLEELAERPGAIIEQASHSPAPKVQVGARAIAWLASLAPADLPRWFFIGRSLSICSEHDKETLESWKRLGTTINEEFATLTPIWRSVWAAT